MMKKYEAAEPGPEKAEGGDPIKLIKEISTRQERVQEIQPDGRPNEHDQRLAIQPRKSGVSA